MKKYIHLFKTNSEFQDNYNGEDYHEPWLSLTQENMAVNYNKTAPEPPTPQITGITLDNLIWVTDIAAEGGVANKNNCSYSVTAHYDNGDTIDVTEQAVVEGELEVAESSIEERHEAGELTLTATYDVFSAIESVIVYQEAAEIDYSKKYFTLKANESGTFSLSKFSNENVFYSINDGEWIEHIGQTVSEQLEEGDTVKFKLTSATGGVHGNPFKFTGSHDFYGNIMSLVYGDDFEDKTTLPNVSGLFNAAFTANQKLRSAENLIIPATDIPDSCCVAMFNSCSSLMYAPELPATGVSSSCYNSMFYGCTSLVEGPSILPATTLAPNCYSGMFNGCSSLQKGPDLPATTMPSQSCYYNMFSGCHSLNSLKMLATNFNMADFSGWMGNVSASGTMILGDGVDVSDFPSGTNSINGIPSGWTVVEENYTPTEIQSTPLTLDILSDGELVIGAGGYATGVTYSMDKGETWNELNLPARHFEVHAGESIQFKGVFGSSQSVSYSGSTAQFNARGNILSTMYANSFPYAFGTGPTGTTSAKLMEMFKNSNIVDASQLYLPERLKNTSNMFQAMFEGCTKLTAAPALTFTGMTSSNINNCFRMFYGCTSLTAAPELPSETLAESCYGFMFTDCYALTTAPELPATALTRSCYQAMFGNCTSLTAAPELPATSLSNSCYSSMFSGCTSLAEAPELPATTLSPSCYQAMFGKCTSLTEAPALPATGLSSGCYTQMFYNCTALTTAPELPATTLAQNCYSNMFSYCTSLATAPALPATTLAQNCYGSMFTRCDALTTAPALPATALTTSCYSYMFQGCISLATAPELPATTLAATCYQYMFNNCTSLNYIKCLATDISASNCTKNWVTNVAPTGTFVKDVNMTGWTIGVNGIPVNWVVDVYPPRELTGISIDNLTWVTDISRQGGTADKDNCTYNVTAHYNNGDTEDITSSAEVTGSLTVLKSLIDERACVGQLTLTATYSGFETSESVDAYQQADNTYYDDLPFTVYVLSAGTLTIKASQWATPTDYLPGYTEYNLNGQGWQEFPKYVESPEYVYYENTTFNVSPGDTLEIRGEGFRPGSGSWSGILGGTAKIALYGNYLSIYYMDNFTSYSKIPEQEDGDSLFYNSTGLINARNLILYNDGTESDYFQGLSSMFENCTNLVVPPKILPSTSLPINAYTNMFKGCTSLTTAPELPATELSSSCYASMFEGCTSLTTAPELPAEELKEGCYFNMFKGCTSLTNSPLLPATYLANKCYQGMFSGCSSLNNIVCLTEEEITGTGYTSVWVAGVAARGTFIKNPSSYWEEENPDPWDPHAARYWSIPKGWTVISGVLDLSENEIRIGESGGSATITVTSIYPWRAYTSYDWISISQVTGNTGETTIEITVPSFDSIRRGTITFETTSGVQFTKTLTVVETDDVNDPFTMTVRSSDNGSIRIKYDSCFYGTDTYSWDGHLQRRVNDGDWVDVTYDNYEINVKTGDVIQFRGWGNGEIQSLEDYETQLFEFNNVTVELSGKLMSLLDMNDLDYIMADYQFYEFFNNSYDSIISIENLIFPTSLTEGCFKRMFADCGNLITGPELPATTLTDYCYYEMFYDCRDLNYIKCLAVDKSANNCTTNWVGDIYTYGTFIKNANASWERGYDGVPEDWTIQDA